MKVDQDIVDFLQLLGGIDATLDFKFSLVPDFKVLSPDCFLIYLEGLIA